MDVVQAQIGNGKISRKGRMIIIRVCEKYGWNFFITTDPQCKCGYGCRPFECEKSKRWIIEKKNLGSPFDNIPKEITDTAKIFIKR